VLMIITSVQDVNQASYSGLKLKPATLLVLQDSLYQMVDVPQAQVLYSISIKMNTLLHIPQTRIL
jgi:hypothetical protein